MQEFPDEEESRDLSGSGPFRHMTCHSYAGGEVMRTLFSNDTSGSRRPMDPTPGDAPSPASGGHRYLLISYTNLFIHVTCCHNPLSLFFDVAMHEECDRETDGP